MTDVGASNSQVIDGKYLMELYIYYSSIWGEVSAAVRLHEKSWKMLIENKDNPKIDIIFRAPLSKNNEWYGMVHKCGFLGCTYKNKKWCNECVGRFMRTPFKGPHSTLMTVSKKMIYDNKNESKFEKPVFDFVNAFYMKQTRMHPEYIPDSTTFPQE